MGPGIIIPLVLLAIVVPVAFAWARRQLKEPDLTTGAAEPVTAPAGRLTSQALRALPTPPWRVVYEIADDRLGGIEHVLVGPAGIFAIRTSMESLPAAVDEADPHVVAAAAITRGALDDALARCAMSTDRLVTVHWGVRTENGLDSVDTLPATTAVDGRAIAEWTGGLEATALTPAQVDLAWQTVLTAIGRPDPLA